MYLDAMTSLLRAFLGIFDNLSDTINTRGTIYHRGTFYADLAKAIRLLLEMRVSPFIESEYNWSWWADQCEERAAELGNDATFAMHLPDPLPAGEYLGYPALTNHVDKLTAFMVSVYQQEMDDADITDLGKVTPAECVKICHRFVHYWLGKHPPGLPGSLRPYPVLRR